MTITRTTIRAGLAALAITGLAASGTSHTVTVWNNQGKPHQVQEPATQYWQCVATMQQWAVATEQCDQYRDAPKAETGIYAKVDHCVYETSWVHHQSAAKCWAMLPQVEGVTERTPKT